jgi:hypothetical protein
MQERGDGNYYSQDYFAGAGTNLDADVSGYNAAAAQASAIRAANSRYCRTTSALHSLSIEKN